MRMNLEAYRISSEPFYQPVSDEIAVFEAAFAERLPVMLKGPTGCGKTRFVEHMAWRLAKPLVTVAAHEDMTASDLAGRYLLEPDGTVWHDGPLTMAVRYGAICYLDEIVEARQDTTVVIHPLTDHRRELPLDRLGTSLRAAPGFQLVISYNPGYQSVLKNIKESTRQRFVSIELDFPPAEIETEVVAHEAGIDATMARALVRLGAAIRGLQGSPLREAASTRLLILAGILIAEGLPVGKAVQSAIVQTLSDDPEVVRALGELADAVLA
jgi:nitric oxide reductase NorQ protein